MACAKPCGKLCQRGIYCKFVTICPLVCCSIRENLSKDKVIVVDVFLNGREMPEEMKEKFLKYGYRLSSDESHLILDIEQDAIYQEIFRKKVKDENGCPYQKK